MSQFQPVETSSLVNFQLIFENILVELYGLLVNFLLKLHSISCCRNINLADDVWVVIFIQFEVISQPFPFYLLVSNMVNAVLHSHKLLAISPLGTFFGSLIILTR